MKTLFFWNKVFFLCKKIGKDTISADFGIL